ncbi:VCBS repeat-containing protein [Mucilaginibacter sp. UR6-11]|uniref:FG-GAP repeat domain-containing protein n=1 Tax=Mucilaginibacter sp. UR6-11 TaxID=1435644 RepID=UPI001E4258AE|nr:VCBS repeat-containing protein [Mucilaginibacter sp. UR6-11]MCC8426867.1 VCBS repeat-containing protein [Mucilaginibacter sp. UR6-11]
MNRLNIFFIPALIFTTTVGYGQVVNASFTKHTLTNDFISEGVTVGDVNRDGKLDILAGTYWFEAPDWKHHEIAPGKVYNPGKDYSTSFLNQAMDVNQDGWVDQVIIGFPGTPAVWYENPKNKGGYWKKHAIMDNVGVGNESPNFVDVNGDGRIDILCADVNAKQMVWLSPPVKKGDTVWTRYPISVVNAPGTDKFSHGLGLGDVNGDGRADVIIKSGWWEAPVNRKQPDWIFHPAGFGEDCSEMYAYDVNGDGYNDVISASAHRYGIWWHEQVRDAQGNVTWKLHEISKAFSETHGLALVDMNGDGAPDLITGKRFFAHNDTDTDPGSHEPAVLYWFEFKRGKDPLWIAHEIDNDSGVGLHVVIQDINNDKRKDIIIGNKKGVFYFENKLHKKKS